MPIRLNRNVTAPSFEEISRLLPEGLRPNRPPPQLGMELSPSKRR